jgi:hypothetical protein
VWIESTTRLIWIIWSVQDGWWWCLLKMKRERKRRM